MSDRLLSVGIVGFGISARVFQLPLLSALPQFRIRAVMSSRPDEVHADLPLAAVTATLPELIAFKPEVIVVTSPTHLHYAMAKTVLEAGIHTVVEKPFVRSAAEGEELVALAKKKGVVLAVFHNRRWDNGFLTIRRLLSEGVIGTPYLYISRFDRIRPSVRSGRWREAPDQGGGLLFDLGSHLIDQALCLFGAPTMVRADLERQRPESAVDDYFDLTLGFGKIRARLQACSFVHGTYPHLEMHGSTASYRKYGLDPQEAQARSGMHAADPAWGTEPADAMGLLTANAQGTTHEHPVPSERGSYEMFYQQLWEAVVRGGKAPVTGEEGLEVIKIIERARGAAAE